MGKILFILLAIIVGYYVIVVLRQKPEESEAPILEESYDPKSGPGTYGAASYYASAMKWNRYDLVVAAASLPLDDWPRYLDTMVWLLGRREEIITQCVAAFDDHFPSNPYQAVSEDIHALLGLARQFGYSRLVSDAAATGIEIEMSILRWFEPLLPDLPAEAGTCFAKLLKAHWEVCEREGRISDTMPAYLEGCIISGPRWQEVAAMEDALFAMRRSMRSSLTQMEYGEEER